MVQINFSLKEVNCKVVYYGPGLSGKTTNLEIVHAKAPNGSTGELTSIATEGDRTLFFDFLPLDLGQVAGMKTKFQIYTVPGQVYYNSTRKLVLQGADGVIFVADSKKGKMQENQESLQNLAENLKEYGLDIATVPIVLQYNKRDMPDVYTVEEMNQALNKWNAPHFEAVARDGVGVFPCLKCLAGLVLESLNRQHGGAATGASTSQKERVPVAVGAVAGAAGGATATATPPAAVQAAGQRPTVAPRGGTPTPGGAAPQPVVALRSDSGGRSSTSKKRGKSKLLIGLGLLGALAGAAALLWQSGILKDLLP